MIRNDLILRTISKLPVNRTPVWFMRQAGRYLPEYRAMREKYDFMTVCKTPDLAAEVTIQPVSLLNVDAAILFSDILVIPEAMGMKLYIEDGKGGPRFESPIRSSDDIDSLKIPDPERELGFVMNAIRVTKENLGGRVPLIGFSGSPWTLFTYMVEGKGSKNFIHAKSLLYSREKDAHRLLSKLTESIGDYLCAQMDHGADLVQIFDTWGGILGPDEFREFSLQYIRQIIERVKSRKKPIILFCKGCGHSLSEIAGSGAGVVGLDWTEDIGKARSLVGSDVALQGNLDPAILFSTPDSIRSGVGRILEKFGKGPGHIFNLGHGILPTTPVENVKVFIDSVRKYSTSYHLMEGEPRDAAI
jgi:uroporphyrinogen decarboxylase